MGKKSTIQLLVKTMEILGKKQEISAYQLSKELKTNWYSVINAAKILELLGYAEITREKGRLVIKLRETKDEKKKKLLEKLENKIKETKKNLLRLYKAKGEEKEHLVSDSIANLEVIRTITEKLVEERI